MGEAAWFSEAAAGRIGCRLCPHGCTLGEGAVGLCKARGNFGGSFRLPLQGRIASLADDPIEKKPLYRFLPGSRVFSVGFFGCSMRCPFCQNWEISQTTGEGAPILGPAELVAAAKQSGAPSIAFTYSEPTIHFEYVLEAAMLARAAGLRTVLVTNGMLRPEPARELLSRIDAVNLDIKSFSASVYAKVLGGDLATVLDFAREAFANCWLEATTLVVPGLEAWEESIAGIAAFLAGLSSHIPLHLSAYHPAWKHDSPPTPPRLLEGLRNIARQHLESVYIGNVRGESSIDRCETCGTVLVERQGYRIGAMRLKPAALGRKRAPGEEGARCAACGHPEFFILD